MGLSKFNPFKKKKVPKPNPNVVPPITKLELSHGSRGMAHLSETRNPNGNRDFKEWAKINQIGQPRGE